MAYVFFVCLFVYHFMLSGFSQVDYKYMSSFFTGSKKWFQLSKVLVNRIKNGRSKFKEPVNLFIKCVPYFEKPYFCCKQRLIHLKVEHSTKTCGGEHSTKTCVIVINSFVNHTQPHTGVSGSSVGEIFLL